MVASILTVLAVYMGMTAAVLVGLLAWHLGECRRTKRLASEADRQLLAYLTERDASIARAQSIFDGRGDPGLDH